MSGKGSKKKPAALRDNYIRIRKDADNKQGYKDVWVYSGAWMRWKCASDEPVKVIDRVFVLTAVEALLIFVGSLRFFLVNWYFSVTTFKLLSLVPLLFQMVAATRLFSLRASRMTVMDYRSLDKELRIAPYVYFGLTICVFIAQTVVIAQHFDVLSLLALAATAVSGAAAFLAGRNFRLLEAQKENNDVKRSLKEINDKSTGLGTGIYVPRHKNK